MSAARAAIGLHAGVAVTLTGVGPDLGVVDRRPIRTRDSQPYHDAVGLDGAAAERLVADALAAATARATADLRSLIDEVAATSGVRIAVAGVIVRTYRLPDTVEAILRSHTACHAAEGLMTLDSMLAACEAVGLEVVGSPLDVMDARVEGAGKLLGAPWRKEQKLAATAALRALEEG